MSTPATHRRNPRRRIVEPTLRFGLLAGMIGVTAWTALSRDSLHAAEHALAKGDNQAAIRHALDDLRIWRWSRASSLVAARALSLELFPDEAEPYYLAAERFGPLPLEAQRDRIQALVRAAKFEAQSTRSDER